MTAYVVTAGGHDQLMADDDFELREFAARLGLTGGHQHAGSPSSHFDLADRGRAVAAGAVPLDPVQFSDLMRARIGMPARCTP